jgi:serine/threonine-protein phosphatase 2A regulatory subunit B'
MAPLGPLKPVATSNHLPGLPGLLVKPSGQLVTQSPPIPDAIMREGPIIDAPQPPVPIASCRIDQGWELIPLPPLATAALVEIPQLAFQKLKQCARMCDFSDADADMQSRLTKTAALTELIGCYSTPKRLGKLTCECHQQVIDVFATNCFRSVPKIPRALLESDDSFLEDVAWPHLELVYNLFLRFVESQVDHRLLQFHLTPRYLSNLFALLDFPDHRERLMVKSVIASVFQNVPPHRAFLRVLAQNMLTGVCDGVFLNAASHLLELFCLFTSGTSPPLSAQMIFAFERVLLPLHLSYRCHRYFQPLVRCSILFVRKDVRLGGSLLQFLMNHWPLTLDHKAQLFIDEITQLLDDAFPCVEAHICDLLMYISMALESPSMSLARRAMRFLTENNFQDLYRKSPRPMLRLIFPALYQVAEGHWQRSVQKEAVLTIKMFMDLDPAAFRDVANSLMDSVKGEWKQKMGKKEFWQAVTLVAINRDQTVQATSIMADLEDFYGAAKPTWTPASQHRRRLAQTHPIFDDDDPEVPEPAVEEEIEEPDEEAAEERRKDTVEEAVDQPADAMDETFDGGIRSMTS